MRPVTDSYLSTVRGSHKAVSRARIVQPGQFGVNPTGVEIPILGGDVTAQLDADVNATLDLTTLYDWPATAAALGTPYGQEIYVESGVEYGTGTKEYVGLGYFRIDSVEQDRTPNGPIRITGSDRSANIRDGRNPAPIQFGAGATLASVFDYLVGQVVPNLVSVYDDPAMKTKPIGWPYTVDEDRLKFVRDLAAAYGKRLFFDYAGRMQVRNAPLPTNAPVWTVNQGRNGVLVSMKRELSRDGVYNAVVATGEPAGELPPVRGVVVDDNPTSPTYWNGPFGRVPRFFSSSFMTTNQQCVNAARAQLAKSTGLPYTVSLGAVPNHALEPGDVITVDYNRRADPETHIIDRIQYGLTADGPMAIETRKQYLT
ncbi:DUF5047 domain-containing protein [Amycolatopsis sp. CA-230715]|uniref:DUF5047 domain-containing protein n=1 Tax=Amycolatopsis sp. CA-230715 TaxID=2745196 RepID=UPI001C01D984|nr:DUF5047 domain-containing protein [Amycolatopsis sp. CA-230715]QWF81130.1 hypothetical protein HUW46_04556 [Amycolatopsis sp. CA-230715]